MDQIQGTQFFAASVGSREYGWSESVWLPSATALPDALVKLTTLAKLRIQMLGAGATLPFLRVSVQNLDGTGGVYRDSQISEPNFPLVAPLGLTPPTLTGGATNDNLMYNGALVAEAKNFSGSATDVRCDFPYSALLLRAEGVSSNFTVRRPVLLRGSPDYLQQTYCDVPIQLTGATQWNNAFAAWKKVLVSADYGIAALDRTVMPNPITAIDFSGAQVTITALGGTAAAVGQLVRISGIVPPE